MHQPLPDDPIFSKEASDSSFSFVELLKDVNRKLSDGRDFEKILDDLFQSLNRFIPYDRIGIALVEGEGDSRELCLKWMKSKIPANHLLRNYCAPLRGSTLEKILETGQPRIIDDLLDYAREHPQSDSTQLILKDGIRSSLTCPLMAQGQFVGIVFFSSAKPKTYRADHVQTYLEIADELSVIIEHDQMRKLLKKGQSKDQNLRMVLHDLKNPLGVIQGFLSITEEMDWYRDLNEDAKNIFSILKRNSEYMLELINELSELSRLTADQRPVERREVNLREFISEVAMIGRELADRKEISVVLSTAPGLPEVIRVDRCGIRRVLENLISNAVKYSQRRTKTQVAIKSQDRRILFEVTDEGQGIPEVEISKLFREFGRTSVKPTEGEPSTGLGLAIARKIVEQHEGEIFVKSQVGQGSTFSFWLPLD